MNILIICSSLFSFPVVAVVFFPSLQYYFPLFMFSTVAFTTPDCTVIIHWITPFSVKSSTSCFSTLNEFNFLPRAHVTFSHVFKCYKVTTSWHYKSWTLHYHLCNCTAQSAKRRSQGREQLQYSKPCQWVGC